MKCLIVTGGFIDDGFTLAYIKEENYQVTFAVDHGLEFFYRTGLVPDYIVGDFDSIEDEVLHSYGIIQNVDEQHSNEVTKADDSFRNYEKLHLKSAHMTQIVRLNPMKDDTDTEHAIHMALNVGCDCIHIFGGTGTRLDHVLGNLQLLGLALRENAECMMLDPHNRIRLINKETTLAKEEQFGKYVSLIPYTPQVTGLTLEGFVYPLSDYTMSSFYVEGETPISGVSNEIADETARIDMKDGILVLVESKD